jgi:hypothetical protein
MTTPDPPLRIIDLPTGSMQGCSITKNAFVTSCRCGKWRGLTADPGTEFAAYAHLIRLADPDDEEAG